MASFLVHNLFPIPPKHPNATPVREKFCHNATTASATCPPYSFAVVLRVKLCMALAATLVELEAQPCGVGRCKPLENSGLERLQQLVKTSRGLPVSLDCRRKILAVSNDDITEVIIPLCSWLKGLVEGHNGEAGGGECSLNRRVLYSCYCTWGAWCLLIMITAVPTP